MYRGQKSSGGSDASRSAFVVPVSRIVYFPYCTVKKAKGGVKYFGFICMETDILCVRQCTKFLEAGSVGLLYIYSGLDAQS